MMSEEITTTFKVEGLEDTTRAFDTLAQKSRETSDIISNNNRRTEVSYKRLAVSVANIGTAGLALDSTWRRVAEGQMNVVEGIIRTIPVMVTLASSIWTVVGAEKARAIAHAIAHSIKTMGLAIPAIAAAATAAFAIVAAQTSKIPAMAQGAVVRQPTVALIGEAGETEIVSPERKLREVISQTFKSEKLREIFDRSVKSESKLREILQNTNSESRMEKIIARNVYHAATEDKSLRIGSVGPIIIQAAKDPHETGRVVLEYIRRSGG